MFRSSVLLLLLAPAAALRLASEPAQATTGTCHLKEKQASPALSFKDFDKENWQFRSHPGQVGGTPYLWQTLYVNPEHSFAMCMIEKNAVSHWINVLNKLETKDLKSNVVEYSMAQNSLTEEKATKVFEDPKSIRAVFVRDPLERFLSAFLDKCLSGNCEMPQCEFRTAAQKRQPVPFKQAVEWIQKSNVATVDPHWAAQSHHCELYKRIGEYNVIGYMSDYDVNEEANCLLKKAGLEHLNTRGDAKDTPVFLKTPKVGGLKDSHEQDRHALLKKFFTKEAAEKLLEIYAEDYKTFDMKRPAWIDEATGEFFDKVEAVQCEYDNAGRNPKLDLSFREKLAPQLEELDRKDDIVELARRAGFAI